jgi:hypothetical protein
MVDTTLNANHYFCHSKGCYGSTVVTSGRVQRGTGKGAGPGLHAQLGFFIGIYFLPIGFLCVSPFVW